MRLKRVVRRLVDECKLKVAGSNSAPEIINNALNPGFYRGAKPA